MIAYKFLYIPIIYFHLFSCKIEMQTAMIVLRME